jgi:glycosyltransferase involved in cell wall biosynthesis
VLVPHLWSLLGPLKRPLVLDLDWTTRQGEDWAPIYYGRKPKSGARWTIARSLERALWSRVSLFAPWSDWAADGLRAEGVGNDRIMVLPPGLDLEQFQPNRNKPAPDPGRPLQLLFVGGDFDRKGGPMLVELIKGRLAGMCEVDIVTRDAVEPSPAIRVHRAEPNSPKLRALYANADLFVMPTRAEAFGIVTIEALASGLPVLIGDVGGARSIVDDGDCGWLIPPTHEDLSDALDAALSRRDELPEMGRRGREVAERRFDGSKNHAHLVSAMIELVETGSVSAGTRAAAHLR